MTNRFRNIFYRNGSSRECVQPPKARQRTVPSKKGEFGKNCSFCQNGRTRPRRETDLQQFSGPSTASRRPEGVARTVPCPDARESISSTASSTPVHASDRGSAVEGRPLRIRGAAPLPSRIPGSAPTSPADASERARLPGPLQELLKGRAKRRSRVDSTRRDPVESQSSAMADRFERRSPLTGGRTCWKQLVEDDGGSPCPLNRAILPSDGTATQ